jgi:hypothetical protein
VKNKSKLELEDIKTILSGAENEARNIGVEQVATAGINALDLGASGKK